MLEKSLVKLGESMSQQNTGSVFIGSGAFAGATTSAAIGTMGVAGGFGAVGLGAVPVTAAGAVVGAAAYGAFDAIAEQDAFALGAVGLGTLGGAGVYSAIGGVGFSAGGTAIGLGMGTMSAVGGIVGLGVYGFYKAFASKSKGGRFAGAVDAFNRMEAKIDETVAYTEALEEVDPAFKEFKLLGRFQDLEVDLELEELKAQVFARESGKKKVQPKLDESVEPPQPTSPEPPNFTIVTQHHQFEEDARKWECVRKLKGHTAAINDLCVSGDGGILASGSDDGTARLWNLKTGRPIFSFIASGGVLSVAIDRKGELLVTGDGDGQLTIWNIPQQIYVRTCSRSNSPTSHAGIINAVDLCGKTQTIASGSGDRTIGLWNAQTGQIKRVLNGHTDTVTSVVMDGDGKTVVSGSLDGTVRIWSVTKYGEPRILSGHRRGVTCIALSADGGTIASGSLDGTVKLWDARTYQLRSTLAASSNGVQSVSLSADGNTLVSCDRDGVKVWHVPTEECQHTLAGGFPIVLSADGKTLVSCDRQHRLKIWKLESAAASVGSSLRQWWQILGVDRDATLPTVKSAYRNLAKMYHPDRNFSTLAMDKMQEINGAYDRFLTQYARRLKVS